MSTYNFSSFTSTGIASGLNGILQSVDLGVDGKTYERTNEAGETITILLYDEKLTLDVEYNYDTDTTAPVRGDIITVGTDKYQVQTIGKSWAIEADEHLKFTMVRMVDGDFPANA